MQVYTEIEDGIISRSTVVRSQFFWYIAIIDVTSTAILEKVLTSVPEITLFMPEISLVMRVTGVVKK